MERSATGPARRRGACWLRDGRRGGCTGPQQGGGQHERRDEIRERRLVRFFFAPRGRWPILGAALAVGFLAADCLFVVAPYMHDFRAGSLWPLLLGALAMYGSLLVGLDLAVQLLWPGAPAGSLWLRMALLLGVATGLVRAAATRRSTSAPMRGSGRVRGCRAASSETTSRGGATTSTCCCSPSASTCHRLPRCGLADRRSAASNGADRTRF